MNRKSKILIIDDEPDMLSACAKIISVLGNDPVPVADVKKAMK